MASDQRPTSKVFIDSSVLIAASISPKGSARDLIIKALRSEVKIIISDLVLEETHRNLANKAPQAIPAFQLFLETLNPEVVKSTKKIITKVAKVIELKDAPIVAGAIKAKADYLASYDRKHLLQQKQAVEKAFKIKIVTPDKLAK